ncbi:Ser/Thr protein kinase RdoA involved in Cpx stress response, MazF antagonist [Pseudomonas sp. ok272]|uniref:phosphotransferase n=1 Tax=unclassified Pseudomonas TaxID=196821 RepID=UPI0008AE10B3|nr:MULTISPECIES: phosphotransferase [unclassified Pseudomonas]SEM46416.1 Ser/Thr protein kinase RdoA involved in Cpx stress response, MazF antagonist [Pseudomonas sp. ok272]SFM18096.1 Ser/Thr protein kinase RdoA involved in Cpx stress response, MazF antagonist [Pseudomonas sp. ok602]
MSEAVMDPACCADLMTTEAPNIDSRTALDVAHRVYGLEGTLKPLNGERDTNFLVRSERGAYVLKFINPAEDPRVISFQTQALLHIERHGAHLPVPRVLAARDGEVDPLVQVAGQPLRLRAVSYLDGISQNLGQPSVALMRELGTSLAEVDLALKDFRHPAAHRNLLWDVGHAERVRPYLDCLEPDQLPLVSTLLDRFETYVKPRLGTLRAQVIHNDLNPHNVMLDGETGSRVAAIIDFGDALHAPLINELGTALSYQFDADASDPLWQIKAFVAAYHAKIPLLAEELEVLGDLIALRMAMAITIAQWRASLYPENRAYVLRNLPSSWRNLQCLATLPAGLLTQSLINACTQEVA